MEQTQSHSPRPHRLYEYNEKGLPVMTVPVPMPTVKPPRDQQAHIASTQQPPKQPQQASSAR